MRLLRPSYVYRHPCFEAVTTELHLRTFVRRQPHAAARIVKGNGALDCGAELVGVGWSWLELVGVGWSWLDWPDWFGL